MFFFIKICFKSLKSLADLESSSNPTKEQGSPPSLHWCSHSSLSMVVVTAAVAFFPSCLKKARLWEERKHAAGKIRRAVGIKIVVKDNKMQYSNDEKDTEDNQSEERNR
ncbi:hypothetical protein E2C01_036588 [Portunus trituberculatus]|uniref:Uncharacterized protein n=1 Tax=Portunus trituberculatus TaxID=210409 RepID=A0A5B7FEQ4_PORTR|nr:hypothetical protein [Portunus trituberculatus]